MWPKTQVLKRARGSALIVVCVLMLCLSWLATSALNSTIYHTKMVGHSTLDSMSLQGAESSITSVLNAASNPADGGAFLSTAMAGSSQVNCVGGLGLNKAEGHCNESSVLFTQSQNGELGGNVEGYVVEAYAITRRTAAMPVPGYDIAVASFHVFETIGVGVLHGGGRQYGHANAQYWQRFGAATPF